MGERMFTQSSSQVLCFSLSLVNKFRNHLTHKYLYSTDALMLFSGTCRNVTQSHENGRESVAGLVELEQNPFDDDADRWV